jgi:lipase
MGDQQLHSKRSAGDPFHVRLEVPVAGGALRVARSGPPPSDAEFVVLAVHGVTASHVAWRAVARELSARTDACVLAPDLRGRGGSAKLPRPYGFASHVDDLMTVLDHAGVERALVVGHSMGAHVVARFAAERPDRAAAVVLLDGGLPMPAAARVNEDKPSVNASLDARMERPCGSADEYLAGWREHPAFARAWDDDVAAYARYDMADDGDAVRCVVSEEAVIADTYDLLFDGVTRSAVRRIRPPLRLVCAARGPMDDESVVIPRDYLEAFAADHPHVHVEHVADTNHYTLLIGAGPGPSRVAEAIARVMCDGASV